jgi:hypothetical protein
VLHRRNTLVYTDTRSDPHLKLDLVVGIGGRPSPPVRSVPSREGAQDGDA